MSVSAGASSHYSFRSSKEKQSYYQKSAKPLINPFNPQKAFRLNFLAGLPLHVLREAEAGNLIKGGLRGARCQHGDLYHAWKRKFRRDGGGG
jgi:hypothetical protein